MRTHIGMPDARRSDTRTLEVSRPTNTVPTDQNHQIVSRQLVGWSERRDAAMLDLFTELRGKSSNGKTSSIGSGKAGAMGGDMGGNVLKERDIWHREHCHLLARS